MTFFDIYNKAENITGEGTVKLVNLYGIDGNNKADFALVKMCNGQSFPWGALLRPMWTHSVIKGAQVRCEDACFFQSMPEALEWLHDAMSD